MNYGAKSHLFDVFYTLPWAAAFRSLLSKNDEISIVQVREQSRVVLSFL